MMSVLSLLRTHVEDTQKYFVCILLLVSYLVLGSFYLVGSVDRLGFHSTPVRQKEVLLIFSMVTTAEFTQKK